MRTAADRIAAAFRAACRDELKALKPGNVHVFSPSRKSVASFAKSAAAAARPLAMPHARVGARILGAVEATIAAVGTNTNLGIILLCAPLAAAAAHHPRADLRDGVSRVLTGLDRTDADLAFKAIATAAPGGLGRVECHDVFAPARVDLRQAMAAAASRDRIARQYVTDFADVFSIGEATLAAAQQRRRDPTWATVAVFLGFLSGFADTHIVREHGEAVAAEVCQKARGFADDLAHRRDPQDLMAALLAWDLSLKQRSINPGTSADLTVATLFAHRLRSILPSAHNND
jgi:triphosphoribosyl-dephospho-CoA synthase